MPKPARASQASAVDLTGVHGYAVNESMDADMERPKYKTCKNCGTRNHPRSGQCQSCGSRMGSVRDWFAIAAVLVIVLILLGLVVVAVMDRPPSPAKMRLPGLSAPAEE
jgi:RNA polymerase subunit RPABC4/transcription elongation factor Spt4